MATRYVHVLATTDAGTRCALKTAHRIASERATRVVLIVPRVVSFSLTLDQPGEDPVAVAEKYRTMAQAAGVEALVRVCFCRERHHVFGRMLIERADVVVGGRRRRWWATYEERLAQRLAAEGHQVTFADVDGESSAAIAVCRSTSVQSV